MPPVRTAPRAAPAANFISFGDDSLYTGGFGLPEGNYAMFFDVRIHAYTKQDGSRGVERLGVMINAFPLEGGDPHEVFLSMGSKAHLSFAPDAETGKRLVAIPGAQAAGFPDSTNWNLFRKSLYDCGLPPGIFTNDLTPLDGIWVHTQNVPEPEQRKGFGAQTGEVQQQQRQGPQMIPVVTQILDDGKPWEGGGGLPEGAGEQPTPAPAPAARRAPAPAAPATRPAARPAQKPAAAPPAQTAGGDDEARGAAVSALTKLLSEPANAGGVLRLKARTSVFSTVKKVQGDEMAQAVINTFFNSDDALNGVLGDVGFMVEGDKIVPAA